MLSEENFKSLNTITISLPQLPYTFMSEFIATNVTENITKFFLIKILQLCIQVV